MKLIFAIATLAAIAQGITAADLDEIQNATPISIALNNPSSNEFGGLNDYQNAAQEEGNLGGYRPLYPPYFQRSSNEPQQTFYDKEYYSRGAEMADDNSRLDRKLEAAATTAPSVPATPRKSAITRIPATGPTVLGIPNAPSKSANDVEVYVVSLNSNSQPESVVQLQNQPQAQVPFPLQVQPQTQFQPQTQQQTPTAHSQQYARQFFKHYRTQQTQSFFYNFKFPSS